MLKAAIMFKDHMILQRDKKISIWGTCTPGETITAAIQGLSDAGTADADGRWCLEIGPLKASFSETLYLSGDGEEIVLSDVQVGDVYLAAGQSNMEFYMRYDADFEEELKDCENDNIRFFDYPEVSYPGQIDEADYGKNFGFWRKACPEDLQWFSATAYYFAKDIQRRYHIPVGILGCNWGGTPACAWMSEDAIREGGGQVWIDEYREAVKELDLAAYDEQFHQNPASFKVDPFSGDPFGDMLMQGKNISEILKTLYGMEPDLSAMDFSAMLPVMGPKNETRPGGLYESMLTQVAPYALRGILYYQGESDGDRHPEIYHTMFPSLIRCFRSLWKEDLPFLFVQIAPFGSWMQCSGEPYPAIRMAQQQTSETVPGTGMAVISDIGMELDIHPKKKQPVGHRLALQAINRIYGEKEVLCEAPTLIGGTVQDGELQLMFENAGDGLHLAEQTPDQAKTDPDKVGGLIITLNGETIDTQKLSAAADGDTIVIHHPSFTENASVSVALGGSAWYRINLYNSAGIPARPSKITIRQ